VQNVDQKADNDQEASSDATSHQYGASNANYPVRIKSSGGGGSVEQTNSSTAESAAGNKNETDQSAEQNAGYGTMAKPLIREECSDCAKPSDGCYEKCDSHGGPVVQNIYQKADNDQEADSSAESKQCCASNTNAPVRIKSDGDDGYVTQTNSSEAVSAAGNKNETDQTAEQSAGSGGGDPVQEIDQKADSDQDASSDATSHQYGASNENTPVRIKSDGYDGDVEQSNDSAAYSAAGNKNDTDQYATQDAGSAPVKESACKDGCGHKDGGVAVQDIGQWASNDQEAESSADSTQKGASNTNAPVRIKSDGDGGDVSQSNSSTAKSAAGNENETDQSADQSAGGWGGIVVQAIGQKAENDQDADSDATSEQFYPSNTNAPVRIKSDGDDGGVEQSNDSAAYSVAGNDNDTTQDASQDAGGGYPVPVAREAGCSSCGGGDPTVQGIGQWASSEQSADSSADSTQKGACNTNAPVRIKSYGDDGDVTQSNSSTAKSAAGNENETDQSADQAGGWGGIAVQALGQKAYNDQDAESHASSQQYDPSNSNTPVRIKSSGGGGSVYQSNDSTALSAAGNKNRTCQRAYQGSGRTRKCGKKERKPVPMKKVD
jgi:trimeric autotransporter adhesin